MNERQLVDAAVKGDQDALSELLSTHGKEVRQTMTGSISVRWQSLISVDDVMQETYADAFLDIHRFMWTGEKSFFFWLRRIAQNNLKDAIKELEAERRGGKVRRVVDTGSDSFLSLYEVLGAVTDTPSREAARKEAKSAIERAVEQLSDAYRLVVMMYDLEGKPAQEVAEACQCSPGAMYMRRKRAHLMLAEILGTASRFLGDSR